MEVGLYIGYSSLLGSDGYYYYIYLCRFSDNYVPNQFVSICEVFDRLSARLTSLNLFYLHTLHTLQYNTFKYSCLFSVGSYNECKQTDRI